MAAKTKAIGDAAEAHVLASLLDAGLAVAVPWGENRRYDLIVEHGGRFWRVQVKAARLKAGAIKCCLTSTHKKDGRWVHTGYFDDADVIMIYCPSYGHVLVLGITPDTPDDVSFRIHKPRNGQRRRIRRAEDYHLLDWAARVRNSMAE